MQDSISSTCHAAQSRSPVAAQTKSASATPPVLTNTLANRSAASFVLGDGVVVAADGVPPPAAVGVGEDRPAMLVLLGGPVVFWTEKEQP